MIRRCRTVGLDEPEFSLTDGLVVTIRRKPELAFKAVGGITGEVTGEVQRLLTVLGGEMKRTDIQKALALRHEDYFREAYLIPALTAGLIEMTIPGKPTSSKQKYRLAAEGERLPLGSRKIGRVKTELDIYKGFSSKNKVGVFHNSVKFDRIKTNWNKQIYLSKKMWMVLKLVGAFRCV